MGIYKLKHPIQFGEKSISELSYPEVIKAIHVKGVKASLDSMDDWRLVMSNCSAEPMTVVGQVEFSDFEEYIGIILEKMGKIPSRQTGQS